MATRALGRVDKLPTFGHGLCCRHLHRHMLSSLHRLSGYLGVGCPIGADVDKVYVGLGTELPPCIVAGKGLRFGASAAVQCVIAHGEALLVKIGQCADGGMTQETVAFQRLETACSHTDKADAYKGNGGTPQGEDVGHGDFGCLEWLFLYGFGSVPVKRKNVRIFADTHIPVINPYLNY